MPLLAALAAALVLQTPAPFPSCPKGQSFSSQTTGRQRALSCSRGKSVVRLQLWERAADGGSFLSSESRIDDGGLETWAGYDQQGRRVMLSIEERVDGGVVQTSQQFLENGAVTAMKREPPTRGSPLALFDWLPEPDLQWWPDGCLAVSRDGNTTRYPRRSLDLHYLQQLAYATGRAFDPDEKRDPELNPGLNAGQVGGLATHLKSDGALLGDDSRFVQIKGADDTSGHWVVQSGKVIANSLESVPVDATKLSPASAVWDSDVHVKKGDANVETRLRRGKGLADLKPGKAYVMKLDSSMVPHPLMGSVTGMVVKGFAEAKAAGAKKVE